MRMATHCAQECVWSAYKLSFYIARVLTARVTESWQRLVGVDQLTVSLQISVCTSTNGCKQENATYSYGTQFIQGVWKVAVHLQKVLEVMSTSMWVKIELNNYTLYWYCRGMQWHSGWGTARQTGRSRVRLLMVPLEFFIDIILLVTLWLWGRLSL
jgi:hypothetical protein